MRPWSAASQLWPPQVSPGLGEGPNQGLGRRDGRDPWERERRPARAGRLWAPLEPCFSPAASRPEWQTEGSGSPGRRGDRRPLGLCRSRQPQGGGGPRAAGPVPSAECAHHLRTRACAGGGAAFPQRGPPAGRVGVTWPGPVSEHLETWARCRPWNRGLCARCSSEPRDRVAGLREGLRVWAAGCPAAPVFLGRPFRKVSNSRSRGLKAGRTPCGTVVQKKGVRRKPNARGSPVLTWDQSPDKSFPGSLWYLE